MKDNYIYPFEQFKTVYKTNKKDFSYGITDKNEIAMLVRKLGSLKAIEETNNIASSILKFLTSDELVVINDQITRNYKEFWINEIEKLVSNNQKLNFSYMGFAYKMPVSLKTNRLLPDLGELVMLARLNNIACEISKLYRPGALVVIFEESLMGQYNGYTKEETERYRQSIYSWCKDLNLQFVKLVQLDEMQEYLDMNLYTEISEVAKGIDVESDKFKQIYNVMRTSVKSKDLSLTTQELVDIYGGKANKIIDNRAYNYTRNYLSILSIRDRLDFINLKAGPNIPLTVAPKSSKVAISLISPKTNKLPYHAVPVLKTTTNLNLEYVYDIENDNYKYKAVYLIGDIDNSPFYYKQL